MINDAQVFLSGYVARDPRFRITATGISNVSLRVAYTPRRVDRETGEWTDGTTSFVSVVCWRTLADNVARCLHKGEPVLVKGRLQVRPYEKDGVSRLAVEVEATSVGHDLARGVASFQRPRRVLAGQAAGNGHETQAGPGGAGGGPVAEAPVVEGLVAEAWTVPARRWPRSIAPTEPIGARLRWTGLASPRDCPHRSEAARRDPDPRNCLPGRPLGPYAVTQRHSSAAS